MVINRIKQYFGLESEQEKLQRYEDIRKSFTESDLVLDELARDFFIEKSNYDARMSEPDNFMIRSKIEERYQEFVSIHKDSIKKAKKKIDSLKKEKLDIEKSLTNHKYIRKEPDGKGGFNYVYEEREGETTKNFKYSLEVNGVDFVTNHSQTYAGEALSPFESRGSFQATIRKSDLVNIAAESPELSDLDIRYEDSPKVFCDKLKKNGINQVEIFKNKMVFEMKPVKSNEIQKSTSYQTIKKAYQNKQITPDQFNTIIKGITKEEKTKYSDFILFNENGEILLLKRSAWEVDDKAGAWVLPGGHVDPGEDFEQAAIRELQEESGFNVDQADNVGSYEDDHCHIEYFQARIDTQDQTVALQMTESRDYKWLPLDEIEQQPMIFSMRENLMKILGIEETGKHKEIIRKDMEASEMNDLRKQRANDLKKALDNDLLTLSDFAKAMKNLSHLVPKRVSVKDKSGNIHQAIRWVNPNTGEAEVVNPKVKEKNKVESSFNLLFDAVTEVINSGMSLSDKVRNLINFGIYDSKMLMLLTGADIYTCKDYLKESEVDETKFVDPEVEALKNKIREEQQLNNTSEEKEQNTLLRDISLDELWENYERNLSKVIRGRHKFAIAYGSGGVGKTYTFEQLAKKFELRRYSKEIQPTKDQYDYVVVKGKISPSQVYAEMYRHRDKLIVFDDCDTFIGNTEVQGFLKGGLDTGEDTEISYLSTNKMYMIPGDNESDVIPSSFSFLGRCITITNLSADQIDQPIKSRALCSNLTMTIDETIEKLGSIKDKIQIYTANKAEIIPVSQESRDIAFEILVENKESLAKDLNTRVYSNAILMINDSLEDGFARERAKSEAKGYFEAVTGSFDLKVRNQEKQNKSK